MRLSLALDLVGICLLIAAAWIASPIAGLAVAGIGALVLATIIEPRGGAK